MTLLDSIAIHSVTINCAFANQIVGFEMLIVVTRGERFVHMRKDLSRSVQNNRIIKARCLDSKMRFNYPLEQLLVLGLPLLI